MKFIRTIALVFSALFPLFAVPQNAAAEEPGTAFCFGIGCPCGNDDPTAGCANSTGMGALLTASGSASVSANDLNLRGTQLPMNSVTLLAMGRDLQPIPFHDGILCINTVGLQRLRKHMNSGSQGVAEFKGIPGLVQATWLAIQPGETWHFQEWYRNAPPGKSACGAGKANYGKSNLSNGITVTFVP